MLNVLTWEVKMKELVEEIIKEVKMKGDDAVRYYARKFGDYCGRSFKVTPKQVKEAYELVDPETITTLNEAIKNISFFAEAQFKMLKDFELLIEGNIIGQKVLALESIGCYVPNGKFPLVSTVLMTVIPAKIAGVKKIVVCSPNIRAEIIVAADLLGVKEIFNLGGVQAIAALAYGTKTIPKVNKIVGPGNKYVTEAKRQVFGEVGIDFLAGPSEVLVLADAEADFQLVQAELLSQLEHDTEAKCWLVSTSEELVDKAKKILPSIVEVIFAEDMSLAIKVVNTLAPEHLVLQVKDKKIVQKLSNYGSLFIGPYSAVAFGDYCSGTNHVLPTNSSARYRGGLSVLDFVKLVTYQKITRKGAEKLSRSALKLSEIEGLSQHKKAIQLRVNRKDI